MTETPLSPDDQVRRYGMPREGFTWPPQGQPVVCLICHALVNGESSALHLAWHRGTESAVSDLVNARG